LVTDASRYDDGAAFRRGGRSYETRHMRAVHVRVCVCPSVDAATVEALGRHFLGGSGHRGEHDLRRESLLGGWYARQRLFEKRVHAALGHGGKRLSFRRVAEQRAGVMRI
jgi:hypothetical protein